MKLAKLFNTSICNTSSNEIHDVTVEVSAEDYGETTVDGFLTYHYIHECGVYENFFFGTRSNIDEFLIPISISDVHIMKPMPF